MRTAYYFPKELCHDISGGGGGGLVVRPGTEFSMIAPVRKFGRARLSTGFEENKHSRLP